MAKSSKVYWADRIVKQQDILYDKTINEYNKQLATQYTKAQNRLLYQMEQLYDKITSADGKINPNDLYRYNRYFELRNNLNVELNALGAKEVEVLNAKLLQLYEVTSKAVGNALDITYAIPNKAAEDAVKAIWCSDGKHWSDRIWNNKAALQQQIEKGLMDCVSLGVPKDEVVKMLKKNLNVGFYQSDRIARTELTHVQNQAAKERYAAAGVEQYKYLAAHDARTSDICRELDGKIFNLREAVVGTNFPPMHPFCRSTILPVI